MQVSRAINGELLRANVYMKKKIDSQNNNNMRRGKLKRLDEIVTDNKDW
jgi:hypothetical protein